MGDLGRCPPCCLANGLTEGEHDTDCDQNPANLRRRLARRAGVPADTEQFTVLAEQQAS